MLTFLAKHEESFMPSAGHIDIGTRSQILEKSKIFMILASRILVLGPPELINL